MLIKYYAETDCFKFIFDQRKRFIYMLYLKVKTKYQTNIIKEKSGKGSIFTQTKEMRLYQS